MEKVEERAPPKVEMIDVTSSEAILKEFFDPDEWVKDEFRKHFEPELAALSACVAEAFAAHEKMKAADARLTIQNALVATLVHSMLDDLVVSTKLLVTGKLTAAGNLMRQSIEGAAISILCCARKPVTVRSESGKKIDVVYWELAQKMDKLVDSNKSLAQLEMNQKSLGLDARGIALMKANRDRYHPFSHPGPFTLATKMTLEEPLIMYLGGHFDEAKIEAYKLELKHRSDFCGILPGLVLILTGQMAK